MENEKISLNISMSKQISYVSRQCEIYLCDKYHDFNRANCFSFLRSIKISNKSEKDITNAVLRIDFSSNELTGSDIHISSLDKDKITEISNNFNIKINPSLLYNLNEAKIVEVTFSLFTSDNILLISQTSELHLLPIEQLSIPNGNYSFANEMLTCFITPNDDYVKEIAVKAQKLFEHENKKNFIGYQANDPNYVVLELDSIFKTLKQEGISYSNPPASFEKIYQRVRLPQNVLKEKQGTCLDLSLLMCSVLESCGLHAVLFLVKGHAFCGCWLEEGLSSRPEEDNSSIFTQASEKGIGKLICLETTLICSGQSSSFNDVTSVGHNNLFDKVFEHGIDVNQCRRGEIYRPIPTLHKNGKCEIEFDVDDILNEKPNEIDTSSRDKFLDKTDVKDKFDYWERKLLDLSLSNRLINFKVRKNYLKVLITDPRDFLAKFSGKDKFSLHGFDKDKDLLNTTIMSYNDKNFIDSSLNKDELILETDSTNFDEQVKLLARKSASAYEESGSNILYLTIGLIEWYPSERASLPNYAPLLLIPIQLSARKTGNYYIIDVLLENARLNITFFEYIKQNFNIDIDFKSDELPVDEEGVIKYEEICNTITRSLSLKNWKVIKDTSYIDIFSFSHFVMWEDISKRKTDLLKNKVVSSLYSGVNECEDSGEDIKLSTIDNDIKPNDLAIPLSADSSQEQAILDCSKGNSFVMFGPPGTGKSQTIANMIVNLMFQGKSVLFVAEKMVALEVVKHRLDEIGLGNFCLQIHSNKISKGDVLGQLEIALNSGKIEKPKESDENSLYVLNKRNVLNSKLEKMHNTKEYFISLYDAILKYESLSSDYLNKEVAINNDFVKSLTLDEFNNCIESLTELVRASKTINGVKDSPFSIYEGREYNKEIRDNIERKLKEVSFKIKELEDEVGKFYRESGIQNIESISSLIKMCDILTILINNDSINFKSLLDFDYVNKEEECLNYLSSKEEELALQEDVTKRFNHNIFDIDSELLLRNYNEAMNFNFFKRLLTRNKIKNQISAYLINQDSKLKVKEIPDILQTLNNYKVQKKSIDAVDRYTFYHFAIFKQDSSKDVALLKIRYSATKKLFDCIKDTVFYNKDSIKSIQELFENKDLLYSAKISNFISSCNKYIEYINKLHSDYKINLLSNNLDFKDMEGLIKNFLKNIEKFNLWILLLNAIDDTNKHNLKFIVDLYNNGEIKDNDLVNIFEYSVYLKIISLYFNVYEFNDFTKLEVEKQIKQYSEAIDEYSKLSIECVASKITKNYPSINSKYITSTESSTLRKLIKSNGKGTTLRQIMNNLGSYIMKICPCFLMSPLSIAQYLDPTKMHFDTVIFDEASQIPTSEAIGAIARGNNVVIAGDPNQMPPTNFFKTQIDDGNFFESDADLDSLLDDCLAIGLPEKHLLWHYRSHHESLIAFSNNKFYKNDLYTFPSPSNLISNVHFINVHGVYEPNRGINVTEAKEIVKEIIRRVKDPVLSKKSIGVVTFNQKQQTLIQDLIDQEYDTHPDMNLRPGGESIFIKNLENVQGDERDVILFSICFAKSKAGRLSLNFGPLSLEKGERRLNVAVSRSRDEMIVFSSIEPIEINANNAKNDGARILKEFLEYAKYGTNSLTKNVDNDDNIIKTSVANFISKDLEKEGYECDLNVGTSNFKIDIAIKNKKNKSEYLLGVVCDSQYYFEDTTCKDRNLLHVDVLKKLGWNLFRVWTIDYYDHPKEVVNSILNEIHNIELEGNHVVKEEPKKILKNEVSFKKIDVNNWQKHKIPYVEYKDTYFTFDDKSLYQAIKQIVSNESPITYSYLKEKIRKMFGVTKIGPKMNNQIKSILNEINFFHTNTPDTYWIDSGTYEKYNNYREVVGFEICDIPYEELGNLFYDILVDQKKITIDDLFKFTSIFYGYSAMKAKTKTYLTNALHFLVINSFKDIAISGNMVFLDK